MSEKKSSISFLLSIPVFFSGVGAPSDTRWLYVRWAVTRKRIRENSRLCKRVEKAFEMVDTYIYIYIYNRDVALRVAANKMRTTILNMWGEYDCVLKSMRVRY
jgi:hypothetical protein